MRESLRFFGLLLVGTCAAWGSLPVVAGDDTKKAETRVELVLGQWLPGESGGRQALAQGVPLVSPFGVDFLPEGTMVIVELEGGRVHALDPSGRFETIAGDGSRGYSGDGGPARQATFNGMHNLAITPEGAILIADTWNHAVRKIDWATKKISTIAGTGEAGLSGDGEPAAKATFNDIMCVALDPAAKALYLADLKNLRVRRIDLESGEVSTVAGNGQKGVPADGSVAVDSPLVDPRAASVDSKGRVYVLERGGHALRRVEPDGRIKTVAGTGKAGWRDGPGAEAQLNSPKHLCVDSADRVFIADDQNAAIRVYDPEAGTLQTVLGRGHGDPAVQLLHPHGVCVEGSALYVLDSGNNRVFRVSGVAAE